MHPRAVVPFLAVAACAGAPPVETPVPVLPPIGDHTIVFGQRVGPISLGMTEAQMLAAGGQPVQVNSYGGSRAGYFFTGLKIHAVIDTNRVVYIAPQDVSYATTAGAHIGSTEADLHMAEVSAWRHNNHGHVTLCFADRTLVVLAGHSALDLGECREGQICDIAIGGCDPQRP